jgi:hypothetical protein
MERRRRKPRLVIETRRWLRLILLNQQTFGIKQKLKMDHGFDRTPLIADRLKIPQYVLPRAAGAGQRHPQTNFRASPGRLSAFA